MVNEEWMKGNNKWETNEGEESERIEKKAYLGRKRQQH
jgi:hypothetical protein